MVRHKQRSPVRHDPARVRRLLAEREESRESYAALSRRSGIPVGTLASWAHRERQRDPAAASAFVEVRVKDEGRSSPLSSSRDLKVVLEVDGRQREIVVPPGFDADELRDLVAVLEEPAC